MKRLLKLREDRKATVAKMRAMLDTAGDANLSEEQDQEYHGLEAKLTQLDAAIGREEKLAAEEEKVATDAGKRAAAGESRVPAAISGEEPPRFVNFGEFMRAVARAYVHGEIDHKLYGASGLSEGAAPDGGFLVQQDFIARIIEPMYAPGTILSRCTPIPISQNSNGAKIPHVDETSRATGSRWGGVRGYWLAEAASLTDSKFKLGRIEYNLKKLGCLGYGTDELVEDAAAAEALLMRAFQAEVRFQAEDAVFQGDGQGKPLGILNAPATVSQAIEATQTLANSNQFIALNTSKMIARLPAGSFGSAVWLVNIELLPTIVTATVSGTAGTIPVYTPPGAMQEAPFGLLWGRPVLFVEYAAQPGTVGDIVLADLSQYGVATKGGPRMDQSMHVKFLTDEMTYRLIYRIDGSPLVKSAVTPYKGAATRSPFVTLAVRS